MEGFARKFGSFVTPFETVQDTAYSLDSSLGDRSREKNRQKDREYLPDLRDKILNLGKNLFAQPIE